MADVLLDQLEAQVVVVRGLGHRLGELFQRVTGVGTIGLGQHVLGFLRLGLGGQLLLAGQVLVQEGLDLPLGQRAHEAVHRLTTHEQDAGGDAADAEHRGQLLFLVGIDLDQLEATAVLGLDFLQDGADHLAGAAPGGPEIDQHGGVHGRLQYFGFKGFDGDVDHGADPGVRMPPTGGSGRQS